MNKILSLGLVFLTALSIGLTGCSVNRNLETDNSITTTPAATPVPTNTPTPTASPTPTNTPTPTVSPTPTITLSPTPDPTPLGGSGLLITQGGCRDGIIQYVFSDRQKKRIIPQNFMMNEFQLEGFSPTGDKLLVSDGNRLYTFDPDGSDKYLITDFFSSKAQGGKGTVYWIPQTNQIVFLGIRNNSEQIFIIEPDGTNLTQLTNSTQKINSIKNAFVDGSIFWSTERNDFRTNIATLETTSSPYSLRATSFSYDGKFLVVFLNKRKYINEVGFGYYDRFIELRIWDIHENKEKVINLTEKYNIGKNFPCSEISNVWWNHSSDRFVVEIKYCDQNNRKYIHNYFLFHKNGELIKEINLPVETHKYQKAPGIYFEYQTKPSYFLGWSPDDRLLIFRNKDIYINLFITNLENNSYQKIEVDISVNYWEEIIWLPDGLRFRFPPKPIIIKTPTPFPYTYTFDQENNLFTAELEDRLDYQNPSFVDITQFSYTINEQTLEANFTFRDIPYEITNDPNDILDVGYVNYMVLIDVDNDLNTGYRPMGWNNRLKLGSGWDYYLEGDLFENDAGTGIGSGYDYQGEGGLIEDDAETGIGRDDINHSFVYKWVSDNCSRQISFSYFTLDYKEDVVELIGEIPGLNNNSRIVYYVFQRLDLKENYFDFPDFLRVTGY